MTATKSTMPPTELKPFEFKPYLLERRQLVDAQLSRFMQELVPGLLTESMSYSVLSGGKRFRALLCLATAEAGHDLVAHGSAQDNDPLSVAMPCACAIEMVHAMSLIHDDLPCMDNDDFRRGKATNHKVFGEAIALLAGDALLMQAFQILLSGGAGANLAQVACEFARALGADGLVGGQVMDLAASGQCRRPTEPVDQAYVQTTHLKKTGALLSFAAWSGAALTGAPAAELGQFKRFGEILGLAFQIKDDLLDVTADQETLGKTPGKDLLTDKATWVKLFGIDASRQALSDLQNEAQAILLALDIRPQTRAALAAMSNYVVERAN